MLVLLLAAASCSGSDEAADEIGDSSDTDGTATDLVSGESEIVLVFDASGSMGAPVGDETRYEVAGQAFDGLLASLDDDVRLGLLMMPGGCFGGLRAIQPGPLDEDRRTSYLTAVADGAVPAISLDAASGAPATPIGAALEIASASFNQGAGARTIVLVSDGEEGCGRPPCEVAQDLIEQGFEVTVEAVGFQISVAGADQLRCVAEATGGSYRDIANADELEAALRDAAGSDSRGWFPLLLILLALVLAAAAVAYWWRRGGGTGLGSPEGSGPAGPAR